MNSRLSQSRSAVSQALCMANDSLRVGQYQSDGSHSRVSQMAACFGVSRSRFCRLVVRATSASTRISMPRRISSRRRHWSGDELSMAVSLSPRCRESAHCSGRVEDLPAASCRCRHKQKASRVARFLFSTSRCCPGYFLSGSLYFSGLLSMSMDSGGVSTLVRLRSVALLNLRRAFSNLRKLR